MRAIVLFVMLLAACAQPPAQPAPASEDSVVPGSIGVTVRQDHGTLVVTGIKADGPAATAGMRVGDVVLRYNGEALNSARQFYRLVTDSAPGSVARLEVLREGAVRTLEVPVLELDTMPRV